MTESALTAAPGAPAAVLPPRPPAAAGAGRDPGWGASRRRTLEVDSLALVGSAVATGLLGLAFWAATAHAYPVAEVGRGSAVVSSAVVLSTLSNLSLGAMFERFLPVSGRRGAPLLLRGHLLAGCLALVLGSAFLLLGPREELFASAWDAAAFPFLVATLSVFALQDQVAVGLQRARWAAAKNVAHSVAKLALVVGLAWTASAMSVVAAWGASALVAAAVTAVAVRRRLRTRPEAGQAPALPHRRDLWAYFGASYGISTITLVAPLLVPLIVVQHLGTRTNAYFALTWSMVTALLTLLLVVVGPFVAAAATSPERLPDLTRRFGLLVGTIGIGGGLFLAVVAPEGLGLIGADYRTEGAPLLHLMAVALPLSVVGSLYTGLARVHRRLRLAVVAQCLSALVVVAGAWLLSPSLGLRGIGLSYLSAEVLVAALLTGPLLRWLRQLRSARG